MIGLNVTFNQFFKLPWLVLKEICSSAQSKIILFSTLKGFKEGLKIFLRPHYVLIYGIVQFLLSYELLSPLLIAVWKGCIVWWLYSFLRPSVERKKIQYALHYVFLIPIFFLVELALFYFSPNWVVDIGVLWSVDWVSFAPWAFFILSWIDKQMRATGVIPAIKEALFLTYMHFPVIIGVVFLHKVLLVLSLALTLLASWLILIFLNFLQLIEKPFLSLVLVKYIPLVWGLMWWIASTLFLISLWVTLYTIAVHNHKKIGKGLR